MTMTHDEKNPGGVDRGRGESPREERVIDAYSSARPVRPGPGEQREDARVLAALNANDLRYHELTGVTDTYPAESLRDFHAHVVEAMRASLSAVDALRAAAAREVAGKIARLGAEHMPILAWGGGAVPEPMGEVCSSCGDGECTLGEEIDALLPALPQASVPETEWEYGVSVNGEYPVCAYGPESAELVRQEYCRVAPTDVVRVVRRTPGVLPGDWLPERGEG